MKENTIMKISKHEKHENPNKLQDGGYSEVQRQIG